MRRIDFDPAKLPLPDGWAAKAEALSKQLADEKDPDKRRKIIDDNEIWKDLKSELRKLSHGKCWYTESPQQGTDVDVDHFRPKKRVAELVDGDNPHPGYWWLAFNHSNYRYSCIVANRRRRDVETGKTGGKADSFPILDERNRVLGPDGKQDAEQPLLIDPCIHGEPELIAFKEDGEAMARFGSNHKYKQAKAERSIELYSLNHSEFVKARISLLEQVEKWRSDAHRFFNRLETGDADHEAGYRTAIAELDRLRSAKEPYSAFCAAMLDRYRHEDYLFGLYVAA